MKKIPVIIADQSSIIRSGLTCMLARNSFLEVKERSSSAEETLSMHEEYKKAVIIADPHLPGMELTKFSAIIKERYPDSVIIVCSHVYDDTCMQHLKNKTINGYLTKDTTAGEIEEAARAGFENRPFTGKAVNEAFARLHLQMNTTNNNTAKEELTDREEEVVHWMLRGLLPEEIAGKLFISVGSVSKHRRHALEKLKMKGEGHLILDALQKGSITVEEIRKWKLI